MVEHRADQDLGKNVRSAEIAGHLHSIGGKSVAGAGAGNNDAGRVDAEVAGVLGDPLKACEAVPDARISGSIALFPDVGPSINPGLYPL